MPGALHHATFLGVTLAVASRQYTSHVCVCHLDGNVRARVSQDSGACRDLTRMGARKLGSVSCRRILASRPGDLRACSHTWREARSIAATSSSERDYIHGVRTFWGFQTGRMIFVELSRSLLIDSGAVCGQKVLLDLSRSGGRVRFPPQHKRDAPDRLLARSAVACVRAHASDEH